jgi:hypothetical protein
MSLFKAPHLLKGIEAMVPVSPRSEKTEIVYRVKFE